MHTNQLDELQQQLITYLNSLLESNSGSSLPQEQFLNKMKQMLQTTDLSYEHAIANNQMDNQKMIFKSMLIRMLSHSDRALHEQTQQQLHLLNGVQIQSVDETGQLI